MYFHAQWLCAALVVEFNRRKDKNGEKLNPCSEKLFPVGFPETSSGRVLYYYYYYSFFFSGVEPASHSVPFLYIFT